MIVVVCVCVGFAVLLVLVAVEGCSNGSIAVVKVMKVLDKVRVAAVVEVLFAVVVAG